MNEAAISVSTVKSSSMPGTSSSTGVRSSVLMGFFSLRNMKAITSPESSAPACTTQNMPTRPESTKKSAKSSFAAFASNMLVVSPTSVAAPCKLLEIAMQMIAGTGEMPSFLQIASATGAIIRTVATLSTNADTKPANSEMATVIHMTFGILAMMASLMRLGIFESMNRNTVPIVPAIIMSTFQSIAATASFG
ncbi:MAG: hypothetical protein BWY81_01644 [Firmicutes bacterium ADurb.Bin467]|nr:MAG: hypothetical protein BWY81_01644 [Firmicutes bacterium ADurb.Bin467]